MRKVKASAHLFLITCLIIIAFTTNAQKSYLNDDLTLVQERMLLKQANASINSLSESVTTVTECSTYNWNGTTYTSSGIYTFTSTNSEGNDSLAILNLTINNPTINDTSVTVCGNYEWNGNIYDQTGQYSYTSTNSNGCDSIAVLNLTIINQSTVTYETVSVCNFYYWNNFEFTSSDVYTYTTTTSIGCDSVIILDLTINFPTSSSQSLSACDSYDWNGTTYTSSGVYSFNTTNSNGCDSLAILNVRINHPSSSIQSVTACNSYVWNANTYNISGVYSFVTTNSVGCDSTAVLNLTINYSSSSSQSITACDRFVWNNNTYTLSGVYSFVSTNSIGCDSIAVLNLTIKYSTSSIQSVASCNRYVWNGNTYTSSGVYSFVSTNSIGCDSFAILDLAINLPTQSLNNVSACSIYVWNGTIYSTSGLYSFTTTNSNGCDSLAILNLIILTPPNKPEVFVTQAIGSNSFGAIVITSPLGNEYSYSANGIIYQNAAQFNNMSSGTYQIFTKDASGCISEPSIVSMNPFAEAGIYHTTTSCTNFKSKRFDQLDQLCYTLKNDIITNVIPSKLYYYTQLIAPSNNFCIDILQKKSITSFANLAISQGNQIMLMDGNCNKVADGVAVGLDSGKICISNAISGNAYILAVKYEPKSAIGSLLSSPDQICYYGFESRISNDLISGSQTSIAMKPNCNVSTREGNWFFSVGANPTRDVFILNINSDNTEDITVNVVDEIGRQIDRFKMKSNEIKRYGSQLCNGVYLFDVRQGSKRAVQKAVKL